MGEATRAGFGQVAQGREGSRGEGRMLSTGAQRKHEAGLGSGRQATCWQVAEERR